MSSDMIIAVNLKSKELYLKVLDLNDEILHCLYESKNDLYSLYHDAIREMCDHYEGLYQQMAGDLTTVKTALSKEFLPLK